MSMLAEKRTKQKWSLNPRGADWSTDDKKFGKKLMESMGWSEGKGLGPKETGITQILSVNVKNDNKGIGYKKSDHVWVEHNETFDSLLKNLQADHCAPDGPTVTEKKSLETVSKQTKRRVHYHKFVRGKDVTSYKEKDMACILGSKAMKSAIPEAVVTAGGEIKKTDFSYTSSMSMSDYFSKKFGDKQYQSPAMKRIKEDEPATAISDEGAPSGRRVSFCEEIFVREFKREDSPSTVRHDPCEDSQTNGGCTENATKKKKKKTPKVPLEIKAEPIEVDLIDSLDGNSYKRIKKKKLATAPAVSGKSSPIKEIILDDNRDEDFCEVLQEIQILKKKKKKKSKKLKKETRETDLITIDDRAMDENRRLSKKSMKRKRDNDSEVCDRVKKLKMADEESEMAVVKVAKKKKKRANGCLEPMDKVVVLSIGRKNGK